MIYYRGKDYRMCTATILWRTIRTCLGAITSIITMLLHDGLAAVIYGKSLNCSK